MKTDYQNILKRKRAPLSQMPSHVIRLVEKLPPRKIHLFLEILPRNPDHGDAENTIPDALVAEPPVEVRLIRLGVDLSLRVEPVLVEDELDSRNCSRFVDDKTEVAVRQSRGNELLGCPAPIKLELPFRCHVSRHRPDAEKETAVHVAVDSARLLDPSKVMLAEKTELLELVLPRLPATSEKADQCDEAKQSFHCASLLSRYCLTASRHHDLI